jgi:hypothetical protein
MSVYSVKGKGWRYDFTQKGTRHTEAWFKTKKEAKEAEARKRQELKTPLPVTEVARIPTDMGFLELLNLRLDYVRAYKSQKYYVDHIYVARKLVKEWRELR